MKTNKLYENEFDLNPMGLRNYQTGLSHDMVALMMQNMMDHEMGKVAPDTLGADYFFLEGFLTDKMDWDFPYIERDFLKHHYEHLTEFYRSAWYGNDSAKDSAPAESLKKKILAMLYNGAKLGDEYCVALIKNLYRLYHKKEYNQLKRFRKMSVPEILSLSENEDGYPEYTGMGRILGMCSILRIPLEEGCSVLYLFLNKEREKWIRDDEAARKFDIFPDELFESCRIQVDNWFDAAKAGHYEKQCKVYCELEKYVDACMRHRGYPEGYEFNVIENYMGLRMQMARTLAVLKTLWPKREFTFEQVQQYTHIYSLVAALTDVSDQFDIQLEDLFGLEEEEPLWDTPLFRAENINIAAQKEKPRKDSGTLTNIAPVSNGKASDADYLAEIAELRKRLNAQEQENRHLRKALHESKTAQNETEELLKKYQSERAELIALREFVYKSRQDADPVPAQTIEQMKKAIANKKIVIIGGHISWINKLRQLFPEWTFIHPDASRSVDIKILAGKERVYFFTDYLNHLSYIRFITAVREQEIPFGYLANRNMENVIHQVHDDFTES